MQDLTPLRLTGGGTLLILVDADGREYVVPVDARLRETLGQAMSERVLARDETAPDPMGIRTKEPTMESTLRPRDIQARIRAGESPEDVAAVAGTSVDRVMVFAAPVLAERAHVAQSAQACSVRRKSAEPVSTVRTLGAAAASRLREEGVDPETVEWDAWRRDDGRWTLVAGYHHDGEGRRATFGLDQPGRFVTADDDEGRWLVGDGAFPTRAEKAEAVQRRLTPVPRYDEDLPLGDDAIELVREDTAPVPDVTGIVAAVRSHRPAAVPGPDAVTGDADWMIPDRATSSRANAGVIPGSSTDRPAPAPAPAPAVAQVAETGADGVVDTDADPDLAAGVDTDLPDLGDPEVVPRLDPASPVDSEAATDPEQPTAEDETPDEPKRIQPRKARGRASVPSWDEIMFGGGRGD